MRKLFRCNIFVVYRTYNCLKPGQGVGRISWEHFADVYHIVMKQFKALCLFTFIKMDRFVYNR